jgi:hypothetical protein
MAKLKADLPQYTLIYILEPTEIELWNHKTNWRKPSETCIRSTHRT